MTAHVLDREAGLVSKSVVPRKPLEPLPPLEPPKQRNHTLDAARGIAALGVIWVHVVVDSPDLARAASLARFGTPFFTIAAIFYLIAGGLSSKPLGDFRSYAKQRFLRLYVPFLIWCVICLVLRNGKRLLMTDDGWVNLGPSRLFMGTARHLWFLPFILLAGMACFHLRAIMPKLGRGRIIVGAVAAALGVMIALIRCPDIPQLEFWIGRFYMNSWMFLPGVLWGVALAAVFPLLPKNLTSSPAISIVGVLILICATIGVWFGSTIPFVDTRSIPSLPRNLAGLGLFMVALYPLKTTLIAPLAAFGRTTYGVYLVHLLFVDPVELFFRRFGLGRHWYFDVVNFLLTIVLSFMAVKLLRSWKRTAWLIP
jgi:peptidoglycan/LPS O-acetylase OafA/YrhL